MAIPECVFKSSVIDATKCVIVTAPRRAPFVLREDKKSQNFYHEKKKKFPAVVSVVSFMDDQK